MIFSELVTATRERCGLLSRDQMADDASVGLLVNSALQDLSNRQSGGWPWLRKLDIAITLPDATGSYLFTALQGGDIWSRVRAVRVRYGLDTIALDPLSASDLRSMYPGPETATGSFPYGWATDGYTLLIGPPPDPAAVFPTVDVQIAEPPLVDPGDTPLMPAAFHNTIVEQAAYLERRRTGKANEANMALQAVQAGLADMRRQARTGPVRASHVNPWD